MQRHFFWILLGLILSGLVGFSSISLAEEGKWTRKADMLTRRVWLSTSTVNGKIYAIGGSTGFGRGDILMEPGIPVVEEYDPITDTWSRKSDMPTARGGLSANAVNGRIYAIGGSTQWPVVLSTVEEYDPEFAGLGVESRGKLVTSWGKLKAIKLQNIW